MKVIKYLCLTILLSLSQQFLASESGHIRELKKWELKNDLCVNDTELNKIKSSLEEQFKGKDQEYDLTKCTKLTSVKVYSDYSIETSDAFEVVVSYKNKDINSNFFLDENYKDFSYEFDRFNNKPKIAGPCM